MLWVNRLFLCPTEMLVTSAYVIKKWLPWGCLGVLNNTGAMNLQQVVQFKLIGFTLFDIKCSLFITDF